MTRTAFKSDKDFNFPNPRFVEFIKRMWQSEPVSIEEKNTWNSAGGSSADPNAPIIVVDKISANYLANSAHDVLRVELTDLGDDFDITFSASSSSYVLHNTGLFEISGLIAIDERFLKYNLTLDFLNVTLGGIYTIEEETGGATSSSFPANLITTTRVMIVNAFVAGNEARLSIDIDDTNNKIYFVIDFRTGTKDLYNTIHNRVEIRRS